MATTDFLHFKSSFQNDFVGNGNKGKRLLGEILAEISRTEVGRAEIVEAACMLAGVKISGSAHGIQKNLVNGRGLSEYAFAVFYWLLKQGLLDASRYEEIVRELGAKTTLQNFTAIAPPPAEHVIFSDVLETRLERHWNLSGWDTSPEAMLASLWVAAATVNESASIRALRSASSEFARQRRIDVRSVETLARKWAPESSASTICRLSGRNEAAGLFLLVIDKLGTSDEWLTIFTACLKASAPDEVTLVLKWSMLVRSIGEWLNEGVSNTTRGNLVRSPAARRKWELLTDVLWLQIDFPSDINDGHLVRSIIAAELADVINRAHDADLFDEIIAKIDVKSLKAAARSELAWLAWRAIVFYVERVDRPSDEDLSALRTLAANLASNSIEPWGPIQRTAHGGHLRTLRSMLADKSIRLEINRVVGNGPSALVAACLGGRDSIVKLLLDEGANIDQEVGEWRQTPIDVASIEGHDSIVELLVNHGADPNKNRAGQVTPLMRAADKGNERLVRLLLQAGADVNAWSGHDEFDAFQNACKNGHLVVAKLLLAAGADINSSDANNETSLFHAAALGDEGRVRFLLDNDADPSIGILNGSTPLMFAERNGHDAIATLLREATEHKVP